MNITLSVFVSLLALAIPCHSQSVFLDDKQSTFYLSGGVGGGEGLTSYSISVGATYESFLDVALGIVRVNSRFSGVWGLGEALSVNIYKERSPIATLFLSLDQSLIILEVGRALSLGGSFSTQFRLPEQTALVFSLGAHWVKPLNSDEKSIISFPLFAGISPGDDDLRLIISPGVTFASDNSVTYLLTFILSFEQRPRGQLHEEDNSWN